MEKCVLWSTSLLSQSSLRCTLLPDLVGANATASKGLAVLSNVEENKSVSHALARLSEVEEKVGQLQHQQYKADLFVITETIKDYVGLMNSIRVSKGPGVFVIVL